MATSETDIQSIIANRARIFVVSTKISTGEEQVGQPFSDVSNDAYYYDAVRWALINGITNGTSETEFSPDAPVTRAQFVTFMWRFAGCLVVDYRMNFKDIEPDMWYTEAVRWALLEGITNGTTDTTFSPNDSCTRAQVITFLARYLGVRDGTADTPFDDVKSDDYFAAAVRWAVENGITNGTSKTTFSPNEFCTRAQVVTFLWRLLNPQA